MHAKPDLRVFFNVEYFRSGSAIATVIPLLPTKRLNAKMVDPQLRSLKDEIVRSLKKAPRGKRGARGHLVHLQDPEFPTDHPELLMTRPTIGKSKLAAKVGGSGKNFKNAIEDLTAKGIVAVSTNRNFNGVPKLIPIKHKKDHRTSKIGTFSAGQYAGFEFWNDRNMSVLHVFDKFGFHLHTNAWDSNTGCNPTEELDNAINGLFRPYPGDIAVQLFSVELLGLEFGLTKTASDHVEYVPLLLGFNPPWDGLYDT